MPLYRRADERKLIGLKPELVAVVRRVSETGPDFIISEGLRTLERQKQLYAAKLSKTLRSKHLNGAAVDCYPALLHIPSSRLADYRPLVEAAREAAKALGVPMNFGYDWGWDAPHWELKDG